MRRLKRVLALLTVALAATVAAASPAAAVPPVVEHVTFPVSFVDTELCEFDIAVDLDATATFQTFFDEEGNPTRVVSHFVFDGTSTNLGTGEVFRTHHAETNIIDLMEETATAVGLPFGLYELRGGIAIRDAGRILFEGTVVDLSAPVIFVGGPHPFVEAGGFPVLCEVMA